MVFVNTIEGGTVPSGTYWSFGSGELLRLNEEGELPGPASKRWIRVPALLLLLLAPILGVMFVFFLPLAGIVLIIYLPLQAVWQKARGTRVDALVGDDGMDGKERA